MSHTDLLRWNGSALEPLEYCDPSEYVLEAADSWLVEDGQTLALGLHRERFTRAIAARGFDADPDAFWRAAIERIPNEGAWFPRVELQSRGGAGLFVLRLRSAPERSKAISLATHDGPDPRTAPRIKGPDLAAMTRLRGEAKLAGADEAVILRDSLVVEGSTTTLLWWEGDVLCQPPLALERIESVTARALMGIAVALGTSVEESAATPADLDGRELWALNALHGIRIVTGWVDGPSLAAEPGRLHTWRTRLDALRTTPEGSPA